MKKRVSVLALALALVFTVSAAAVTPRRDGPSDRLRVRHLLIYHAQKVHGLEVSPMHMN